MTLLLKRPILGAVASRPFESDIEQAPGLRKKPQLAMSKSIDQRSLMFYRVDSKWRGQNRHKEIDHLTDGNDQKVHVILSVRPSVPKF
jgi:hypothetical protein